MSKESKKYRHIFLKDGWQAFAEARKQAKSTNAEIAEIVELPQGTISRAFIAKYQTIHWRVLIKLAKVLGVNESRYIKPKWCGFNLPLDVMAYRDSLSKQEKTLERTHEEIWGDFTRFLSTGYPSFILLLNHTGSGMFYGGKKLTVTTKSQLMKDYLNTGDVSYRIVVACSEYFDVERPEIICNFTKPSDIPKPSEGILAEIESWLPSAEEITVKTYLEEVKWKVKSTWIKTTL